MVHINPSKKILEIVKSCPEIQEMILRLDEKNERLQMELKAEKANLENLKDALVATRTIVEEQRVIINDRNNDIRRMSDWIDRTAAELQKYKRLETEQRAFIDMEMIYVQDPSLDTR